MKKKIKSAIIALAGILAAVYLANPSLGFFELLPDNLPLIGNMDEAAATVLLLSSLAYFGIDLHGFFGRRKDV